jgi:AraC-like DNA-binding protein
MARVNISDVIRWRELAGQSGFNASVLAQLLNISTRQLRRYTLRLFGQSAQRWLDTQRLERAAMLVKQIRIIKVVAHDLQYKQVSHFSREFKIYHGLSPRQYLDRCDQESAADNKWPH